MKFAITFNFKDERGYMSEDIIVIWADDEKQARQRAKMFLRTTHKITDVKEVSENLLRS